MVFSRICMLLEHLSRSFLFILTLIESMQTLSNRGKVLMKRDYAWKTFYTSQKSSHQCCGPRQRQQLMFSLSLWTPLLRSLDPTNSGNCTRRYWHTWSVIREKNEINCNMNNAIVSWNSPHYGPRSKGTTLTYGRTLWDHPGCRHLKAMAILGR